MKVDLIFNPIVKSKWRKVYLILLFLFTTFVFFLIRKDNLSISEIWEIIKVFIFRIYPLGIFPITFFFFSLKWCWKRYTFLSWEEIMKIVIYSLIFLITFFDLFCYTFRNLQL